MNRTLRGKKSSYLMLTTLVSVAGCFQASTVRARSSPKWAAEQALLLEQHAQINQLGQTLALQATPLAGWVFPDPGLSV